MTTFKVNKIAVATFGPRENTDRGRERAMKMIKNHRRISCEYCLKTGMTFKQFGDHKRRECPKAKGRMG